MRQIAADPNVEYVEVDKLNKPLLTPNDTNFTPAVGLRHRRRRHLRDAGLGRHHRHRRGRGRARHRHHQPQRPQRQHPAGLRLHHRHRRVERWQRPRQRPERSGRLGHRQPVRWHPRRAELELARHPRRRHRRRRDQQRQGRCGHGLHRQGRAGARARHLRWLRFGHRRRDHLGVGRHGQRRPRQCQSGRSDQPQPRRFAAPAVPPPRPRSTARSAAAPPWSSPPATTTPTCPNASPANCANVVAVGSITSTGARSSFSNYGALVDIAAPGSTIMSTMNAGTTSPGAETYVNYNGTSMATPHVAGIVALMQAHATTPKTPAEIESLLKSTARAFPSTPSQPIGAGIAQAKAAVDAVNGTPPPPTGVLTNGTPVTGLSGATGTELRYTLVVPAGASGLKFVTSGGTGDADLYAKFGSAPQHHGERLQVRRQHHRRDLQHRHRAGGYVPRAGQGLLGDLGRQPDRQLHHRRWRHAGLQQHQRLHDRRQRSRSTARSRCPAAPAMHRAMPR